MAYGRVPLALQVLRSLFVVSGSALVGWDGDVIMRTNSADSPEGEARNGDPALLLDSLRVCKAGAEDRMSECSGDAAGDDTAHVQVHHRHVLPPELPDFASVICPFLSTLLKEKVLPVKSSYTKQELRSVTMRAGGLDKAELLGHIESNFLNNPSGVLDLFNMEGAVNEHIFSTGINDCKTDYKHCTTLNGTQSCPGATTKPCHLPNEQIFERFFRRADADRDGSLSLSEIVGMESFPTVDRNLQFGQGSIEGSFRQLILVFGQGGHITKSALERVLLDRLFPEYYKFPAK
mmetsp:Transcript_41610/g.62112  ORF Transcript_41610/g.62112 Transcript_41610/m.62112 type:complete len:291 (-) Transcript_41610:320-1192(-)